jgi:hypothetical protein
MTQEEREAYWRGIIATHRPWDTAKAFVAAMNERDNLLREIRSYFYFGPNDDETDVNVVHRLEAKITDILGEQPRPS